MQILHTEVGDIHVVRAFQSGVNDPIIFETPQGTHIYRNNELVKRSELERLGIVPPLKNTFALDERLMEKEYRTAGGARRGMYQKKLSADEYVVVSVLDSDGDESFVIRHKDSQSEAAFVQRDNGLKSGTQSVAEAKATFEEEHRGGNEVSEV